MKTYWKIIAGIAAFLILLILGLNIYLSDERIKSTLIPIVEEATGRQPDIESVSLTFFKTFPHPGVSINNMSIPGKNDTDTLASLDELAIGIHISSLFSSNITLSELELEGLRFTYRVYPDGSTNLDFLMSDTEGDTAGTGYAFNIPYFQIENSQLGYVDSTSGTFVNFRDLNGDVSLRYKELIESTIDIKSDGMDLTVNGSQFFTGLPVSLSEISTIDTDNELLTLKEGAFSVRALSLNLQGTIDNWSSTPGFNLEFSSSSDDLSALIQLVPKNYRDRLEGFETGGSMTIDGTFKGTYSDSEIPAYTLQAIVQNGRLKYPNLPQSIENIELNLMANNEAIQLNSLNAEAGPNTLSAAGTIGNPFEQSRTFDLETDLLLDLSSIKDFYPIDEDTLSMRGKLEARAVLKGNAENLEQAVEQGSITLKDGYIDHKSFKNPVRNLTFESVLEGGRITIVGSGFESGDNSLNAAGTVTDYLGGNRAINLRFKGNLNFGELTDYYDPGAAITSLSGGAGLDLRVEGPVETPADLNLKGTLSVSNLNMDGPDSLGLIQPVKNLNGNLSLSPDEAKLEDLDFELGSSDFQLNGTLEDYMQYMIKEKNRSSTPRLIGSYSSRYLNVDELIDWDDTTSTKIPIHLPDLNSNISTNVEQMVVTGVSMHNLEARMVTTPEDIKLNKARVEMFEGSVTGLFIWKVPEPTRTNISFEGKLDSLRLERFFSEYPVLGLKSDFHKYVSGTFNSDVNYYSELDAYLQPVIETTRMEGSFGMSKSRIQGHPVQDKIAVFLKTKELRSLSLDRWKSIFEVNNSTLKVDSLRLTSGDIGAELSGTRHLVNSTVDYRVKVYLPGRFKGTIASVITEQATNALTQENGTIMVPLRITGTADDPKIAPDQEIIKPIIKKYLKDKAGSVLDKLFKGNG